jgi:hypothetical protein
MRANGRLINFDELVYRQRVPVQIEIECDLSSYNLPAGSKG